MLPDLPQKILEKLKIFEGAIILNQGRNHVNINNLGFSFQGLFRYIINILKMFSRIHDGYQMPSEGLLLQTLFWLRFALTSEI